MTPHVTIVIPTRDRPELADRAISSALCQTYRAIEVVLVDDGSTAPVRPATADPRLRVVRRDVAGGVCAARNLGMREARGEWIAFLDDDDELLPNMIEESLSAAAASQLQPPIAVLSALAVMDHKGRIREIRRPVTLPRGAHYFLEPSQIGAGYQTQNSLVAPIEVIRSIGGWDEHMRASMHDDLFLRLNAVCSIQGIPDVTYRLIDHGMPRLHSADGHRAESMERTLTKHAEIFKQHPAKRAHYLATMGITYLRGGRWWPAIRWTTRALIAGPRRPKFYLWWLASLAGPRVLTVYQSVRSRISPKPRR